MHTPGVKTAEERDRGRKPAKAKNLIILLGTFHAQISKTVVVGTFDGESV